MAQTKLDPANGAERKPSLGHDLDGVVAGRRYATQTDERIPAVPQGEIAWFWADTRVQGLNVETFNGFEVGAYDLVRDRRTLRAWRAMLRVLDGTASVADVKDTRLPQRKGRQKGARLVDGRVVYPGDEDEDGEEDGMKRERKKERSFSLGGIGGGAMGNSQMLRAGLAMDSEDETSGDETGGESGLDSGVDAASRGESETQSQGQLARKNVREGKMPGMPRSKMKIVSSVEVGTAEDDEDEGEDYDYEAVKDLVEGEVPLARGGTEESEGGDYNPWVESFQSTAARRSSSGPREKRMRF